MIVIEIFAVTFIKKLIKGRKFAIMQGTTFIVYKHQTETYIDVVFTFELRPCCSVGTRRAIGATRQHVLDN